MYIRPRTSEAKEPCFYKVKTLLENILNHFVRSLCQIASAKHILPPDSCNPLENRGIHV